MKLLNIFNKKKRQPVFTDTVDKRTLHKNLDFTAAEQYKLLRVNLEFTLPQDEKCPVIGVTSSFRGEAKSTTAINLSYVLAEKGSKVLLIDGDLRLPSVAKKMGTNNDVGLTEFLVGNGVSDISGFKTDILDNWYIVPSGRIPPNPSELLGSKRMKSVLDDLRESFDYIVIDLPPVNIVSDASAISNLISGMLVVVREGYCEKRMLAHCVKQLELLNVNILGFVMTGTSLGEGAYGKKYKYYKKDNEEGDDLIDD